MLEWLRKSMARLGHATAEESTAPPDMFEDLIAQIDAVDSMRNGPPEPELPGVGPAIRN